MSSAHSIHVVQLCSPSFATMQDTDPYAWLQYVSVTWNSGLGLSMATGKELIASISVFFTAII
jgi:hypothetical protein